MTKLAIDAVLFPSSEVVEEAIKLNKELLLQVDNNINLNRENCLPHISLAMGGLEEDDLSIIYKDLKEVAQQSKEINLKIIDIHIQELENDQKASSLVIEKTKQIQAIHEKVIEILMPYFTSEVTKDMLCSSLVEAVTLNWIRNYLNESSFENFFPHITIGFGKINNIKLPIYFTATKLAICHFRKLLHLPKGFIVL